VDQVIPSLAELLAPFRACFRQEVFVNFQHVLVAWLLCPGRRTLTEVWQVCSLRARRHYTALYHLFAAARWHWDEIGTLLCLLLLTHLVPGGIVWIVVDDTLCHKRGKRVAFGGIFLDPVLSSKTRKVFRYGLNYVVLGLAVRLPFRQDRYHCLPVLWRVFRKKGTAGHCKKTELARELACLVANLIPAREVRLVCDSAYVNAAVLRDRPANLELIGPLPMKAALYGLPQPRRPGRRGPQPKKGARLATPREMFEDQRNYPAPRRRARGPGGAKDLRVQVVKDVLWYSACKARPVQVVLVRDPSGQWPDTALLSTDVGLSATEVIEGYARRWSIEVAFHDSKQYLGLHDPQVWSAASVERAHPMAWFAYSVSLLWYAVHGARHEAPRRERPWYAWAVRPACAEILGTLRLALWRGRYGVGLRDKGKQPQTAELLEGLDAVLHCLAAVR
jgi:DDE superfamily endonuclease